jgi:hypothetical protein
MVLRRVCITLVTECGVQVGSAGMLAKREFELNGPRVEARLWSHQALRVVLYVWRMIIAGRLE